MSGMSQDTGFILVEDGYTELEAYQLLAGLLDGVDVEEPLIAAANEGHTGAMIALVPSDADVERLALKDGEDPEQLHLTLAFLGEAADISDDARTEIEAIARRFATAPISANGFSINVFNPAGDEPCVVMGVGNGDSSLEDLRSNVVSALRGMGRFTLPEQHTPWIPHVTLAYTDDFKIIGELAGRTGPITFDKIRVAFAGENVDIPLDEVLVAHGSHDQSDHGNWADGDTLRDSDFKMLTPLAMSDMQGEMMTWSDKQKKALQDYTSAEYKAINKALRNPGLLSAFSKAKIATIKSAMAPTTKHVRAWRGTNLENFGVKTEAELEGLVGKTLVDKGFTSTTIDPGHKFPGGKVRVNVEVPKGTFAAYLGDVSHIKAERELLLDAGTKFKVQKVMVTADGYMVWVRAVQGE